MMMPPPPPSKHTHNCFKTHSSAPSQKPHSAIDKLDKEPWDVVRAEMVEEKGLPGDVADTIGQFVVLK